MPSAAPRPCRRQPCAALVTDRDGYCQAHRREKWRNEGEKRDAERKFYWSKKWKKIRAAVLARELDLPAAIGVPGALAAIPDGATVTVDPATGEVRIA